MQKMDPQTNQLLDTDLRRNLGIFRKVTSEIKSTPGSDFIRQETSSQEEEVAEPIAEDSMSNDISREHDPA